jgi:hypothetical protein
MDTILSQISLKIIYFNSFKLQRMNYQLDKDYLLKRSLTSYIKPWLKSELRKDNPLLLEMQMEISVMHQNKGDHLYQLHDFITFNYLSSFSLSSSYLFLLLIYIPISLFLYILYIILLIYPFYGIVCLVRILSLTYNKWTG